MRHCFGSIAGIAASWVVHSSTSTFLRTMNTALGISASLIYSGIIIILSFSSAVRRAFFSWLLLKTNKHQLDPYNLSDLYYDFFLLMGGVLEGFWGLTSLSPPFLLSFHHFPLVSGLRLLLWVFGVWVWGFLFCLRHNHWLGIDKINRRAETSVANVPGGTSHSERSGLTTTLGCLFGFVCKKKPTYLERFSRKESSQRTPPFFFVDGGRPTETFAGDPDHCRMMDDSPK